MSTSDYLLYTGLFVAILATQLGTRRPDLKRLLLPVAIVGGIGAKYLRDLPTGSTSHLIELAGIVAGLLFGVAAVAFIRVHKDPTDGRLTTTAGWRYGVTWLAALALRLGFAYGSTHWFARPLDAFSRAHHVTPTAYAAAPPALTSPPATSASPVASLPDAANAAPGLRKFTVVREMFTCSFRITARI